MTAEYFDEWYVDIDRSTARQQLFTDTLGLPAEIGPSNLVPLAGLHTVAAALAITAGATLVDLACGRGGPGMWLARELEAELIGIDFSTEAIAQASARRKLFGLERTATFAVGSLDATGLPTGCADATVCIDAFQFAPDAVDSAAEIRRILRPGGRVVLTSWEAVDPDDDEVPERIRKVDLSGSLTAAGFVDVVTQEQPAWHDAARSLWVTTLATDPGGDPALTSMQEEGTRSLAIHDRLRRVMATANAP